MAALHSLRREPAWMTECEVVREERDRERDMRRDEDDDDARRWQPNYRTEPEGAPE